MQTAQSSAASYVDPDTLSPETGEPFSKATTARYLVAFVIFAILNCAAFVLNGNTLMPQPPEGHRLQRNRSHHRTRHHHLADRNRRSALRLHLGRILRSHAFPLRQAYALDLRWFHRGRHRPVSAGHLRRRSKPDRQLHADNLGQGAIQTPMFAILADRVPKSVRGTLSAGLGATALGTPVGQFLSSLFLGQPYQNMGFVVGALMIAASGIIPLLILPRERSSKDDGDRQEWCRGRQGSVGEPAAAEAQGRA